jgi:hypothetical protein
MSVNPAPFRNLRIQAKRLALNARLLPSQKVTFVRQATVRPDLPPPPVSSAGVGYRIE